MTRGGRRRRRRVAVVLFLAGAVLGGGWVSGARTSAPFRIQIAMTQARDVSDHPTVLAARLAFRGAAPPGMTTLIAPMLHPRSAVAVADTLLALSRIADGDTARYAEGTARALVGDYEAAVQAFEAIPPERRDAAVWNDIAAVNYAGARGGDSHDGLLSALDATAQALKLDPHFSAARFNRARAAGSLGLSRIARKEWSRYVAADPASPWAAVAWQQLGSHRFQERTQWVTGARDTIRLTRSQLIGLARRYPEQARRFGEAFYLALWADAVIANQEDAARRHLELARTIGDALNENSGESLLRDAVATIDAARDDPRRTRALAEAYVHYRAGRQALDAGTLSNAAQQLAEARRLFQDSGSPMAAVAATYGGTVLIKQNRMNEALAVFRRLLAANRAGGRSHKALRAHVLWEMALCEAVRGHWSASVGAASEATAIFRELGERGNAAATETILSEDYDLLGRPELAWKHGLSALHAAFTADERTIRVALATLCRTELRGKRWRNAATLAAVERESASGPDPRLDPDMFLRAAAAEHHLGNDSAARAMIRNARATAAMAVDEAERRKLVADIDGAAGSILRHTDPARAVALLSDTIAFQQHAARPIVLPQLFLERGRAFASLGRLDDAERDFGRGIEELERERNHVSSELRPGIFDDAFELFDETIALRLKRRSGPDAVLAAIERGRARAMLEEMEAGEKAPSALASRRLVTVREVQRSLAGGEVLLEYASLPDRLVILVISRREARLLNVPIAREALERKVRGFIGALASASQALTWRFAASELHQMLIAPALTVAGDVTFVHLIPDTTLQRVPFAALYDQDRRTFLVERFSLAMQPSAAIFVSSGRARPGVTPDSSAVVFANPSIPRDLYPDLASLRGADFEAFRIARHYPNTTAFTGEAATARRFLELAPGSKVVHFAGHAVVSTAEPSESALVLASSDGVTGALTQRQIARMKFRHTRVVVLAACSTIGGRNAAVEGVPSLARAFIVAGVPAVIGTLWDIEDRDAAPLVDALHSRLARGTSPAEALRGAQLAALRSENHRRRHPSHWSAFAAIGR